MTKQPSELIFHFHELVEDLLTKEGGYINDPDDPGGETNFGITKRTAREAGYSGPMQRSRQKPSNTNL